MLENENRDDARVVRLWLAEKGGAVYPLRMEAGRFMPGGEWVVVHEVDVLEIAFTEQGLPYPKRARQRLHAVRFNPPVCFTERLFETRAFEANIAVSDEDFAL